MAGLLSVEEALDRVLARAAPLPSEVVPLGDAAGRVLAEAAHALVDLPPFASSAMDGFAVRAADGAGPLAVVGRAAAGRPAAATVGAREAIGISTGGVVPDGADAVVPIERVTESGQTIAISGSVASGDNIREQGGDVRAGDEALPAGVFLTPARIAALAACGAETVRCGRRPHVAIVTTGTELRPPGAVLAPGEIYESNGIMLAAALRSAGAIVALLGVAADDLESHRTAIERGLDADVLVTSGGVSVGPHDLVRRVESDLGVVEVFWRVAMRPGKPIAFGHRGSTLVFGLPGNPVSALVGCLLFVVPGIMVLQGAVDPRPRFLPAVLAAPLRANPQRDDFVRARSRWGAGGLELAPITGQDSHMIVRSATADALVHVPRGDAELPAGAVVRYLPL